MKSSKQIKREIEVTNTSILKLSEEVKAKKAKVASLKAELKTATLAEKSVPKKPTKKTKVS